jgi:kynurenine formamidase
VQYSQENLPGGQNVTKIRLVSEKGIGQLINEFDEGTNQTVEQFNVAFPNCQLKGFNPTDHVIIGDYVGYNHRNVYVNNKHIGTHLFTTVDYSARIKEGKEIKLYYPNRDFIGQFVSITEAARAVNTSAPQLIRLVEANKYLMEEVGEENAES